MRVRARARGDYLFVMNAYVFYFPFWTALPFLVFCVAILHGKSRAFVMMFRERERERELKKPCLSRELLLWISLDHLRHY